LYVGISSYSAEQTAKAVEVLREMGTPMLIHQPRYSMLDRWVENGLLDVLEKKGVGCITFSSLEQGLLTSKYLHGIPEDSRAASERGNGALEAGGITPELIAKVQALNGVAEQREQTLAQMSLSWILKDPRVTSVIIGASKPEQVLDSVQCLRNYNFSGEELEKIESILAG
jgi:L-glyceraldehyde 3-phosphate reductase